MMTDTEFFHEVQSAAQEIGADGQLIHKALLPAYHDLAQFLQSLGPLAPQDFGAHVTCEDPYVFADWEDKDTGCYLSLQFSEDGRTLVVYPDSEGEFPILQRQFTPEYAKMLVYLFSKMPSRFAQ